MLSGLLVTALLFTLPQQSSGVAAALDPKLIRVYVSAPASDSPDDGALRRESVKHLKSALASRKKDVIVVDDEDKADLAIEVVERTVTTPKVVIGLGPRPGQPGTQGPSRLVHLYVQLSAPRMLGIELRMENKNRAYDTGPGWESAADDIAKQIVKWSNDNRARLIEKR
jgi:hypothetical protein